MNQVCVRLEPLPEGEAAELARQAGGGRLDDAQRRDRRRPRGRQPLLHRGIDRHAAARGPLEGRRGLDPADRPGDGRLAPRQPALRATRSGPAAVRLSVRLRPGRGRGRRGRGRTRAPRADRRRDHRARGERRTVARLAVPPGGPARRRVREPAEAGASAVAHRHRRAAAGRGRPDVGGRPSRGRRARGARPRPRRIASPRIGRPTR